MQIARGAFYDLQLFFFARITNPNLKHEKSHNFQFSFLKKIIKKQNWIQPELSVFYNSITQRILLTNIKDANYTYTNLDNFKALTSNLNFSYKLKSLTGNTGFSSTSASTSASGFKNPFHAFEINGNASYIANKLGVTSSIFVKYTSQSTNFVTDQIGNLIKIITPSYTWLDITFSKPFVNNKWNLAIGAKNILNITNLVANGNVGGIHSNGNSLQLGMGRVYFIKLEYNFVRK